MILEQIKKVGFSLVLTTNMTNITRHFRRLSNHHCIDIFKEDLDSSSIKSNLHSVVISGNEELVLNMFSCFEKKYLHYLRILDLQDSKIHEIPKELGDLFYLQYLSLRHTKVRKLPKTIGQLWNLQTLDLKETLVSELPKEMKYLHKLRHLLAYYYDHRCGFFIKVKDIRIPQGVLENLKELQKLAYLNVCTSHQVIELRSLKQLTRLAVTELRKEDGVALCEAIEEMKHLKGISIRSTNEIEFIDIQVLESPPLYLEHLTFVGLLKKLPNWIKKLDSLMRVFLRNSRVNEDSLSLLQGLPNLVYLGLEDAYDGEKLDFGINGFSKLSTLYLVILPNLKMIKGSLPCLRKAFIALNLDQVIDVPPHIKLRSRIRERAEKRYQSLTFLKE